MNRCVLTLLLVGISILGVKADNGKGALSSSATQRLWNEVWSEEFVPCTGGGCVNGLNTAIWSFEEGDGTKYGPYTVGWGNNEMQCYTTDKRNVKVKKIKDVQGKGNDGKDGVLMIESHFHREGIRCRNPGAADSTRYWTSARLITRGKAAFGIGESPIKIEARVKVPSELGAWAAFWMLPDTNRTDCLACGAYGNSWCISGEIDIMETRNGDGKFASNVIYGGWQNEPWNGCHYEPVFYDAAGGYHGWNNVSVVMERSGMTFYVNDVLVQTVESRKWFTGAVPIKDHDNNLADYLAPFDRPFYLILDLAVGGNYAAGGVGGVAITDSERAPYQFLVDWVRVSKLA